MEQHNLYSIWLALHEQKMLSTIDHPNRKSPFTIEQKELYENLTKKFNRQAMHQETLS